MRNAGSRYTRTPHRRGRPGNGRYLASPTTNERGTFELPRHPPRRHHGAQRRIDPDRVISAPGGGKRPAAPAAADVEERAAVTGWQINLRNRIGASRPIKCRYINPLVAAIRYATTGSTSGCCAASSRTPRFSSSLISIDSRCSSGALRRRSHGSRARANGPPLEMSAAHRRIEQHGNAIYQPDRCARARTATRSPSASVASGRAGRPGLPATTDRCPTDDHAASRLVKPWRAPPAAAWCVRTCARPAVEPCRRVEDKAEGRGHFAAGTSGSTARYAVADHFTAVPRRDNRQAQPCASTCTIPKPSECEGKSKTSLDR